MDCKNLICELMRDIKTAKISYLQRELIWKGVDSEDFSRSLNALQERGVIYRKKGGLVELTDPHHT